MYIQTKKENNKKTTNRGEIKMLQPFDVQIATELGVSEAVFINNLQFFVTTNKDNNVDFHEGRWWSYNSIPALMKIFPYWTGRQLEHIIKKLVDSNVILTGNFNTDPRDRTRWFAFVDEYKYLKNNKKIQGEN